MSDWTSGYVADIGYTYGYYGELNPLKVKLAFLNAGLVCPDIGTACELGFGQGISTNFHAAGSLVNWYGTDFNPSQAGFAAELANKANSGAQLFDDSFEEFLQRDIPEFDYIGLHGIWSWISDENRKLIVEFVKKKLKVGGVLYISYNTLPGLGSFAPMRHLMTLHAQVLGSDGAGIVQRINGAIEFTEKLLKVDPAYLRVNPQITERFEHLKKQNRQYLAHEYFNEDWEPMHFAEVSKWLAPAKIEYACSASTLDSVAGVHLTNDQREFLNEIRDTTFRESTRDFLVSQQFRKDYWVKGARRLNQIAVMESARTVRFLLLTQASRIKLTVKTNMGEVQLAEKIYQPLIDLMADFRIRTFEEIEKQLTPQGINLRQVFEALLVLVSLGHCSLAQDEAVATKCAKSTRALNQHLLMLARFSGDISFLASPVTGGGHMIPRFQQLFLLAKSIGLKTSAQWAEFTWSMLKAQGQSLLKQGQPLTTEAENLAELTRQAEEFEKDQLPILKALQIA